MAVTEFLKRRCWRLGRVLSRIGDGLRRQQVQDTVPRRALDLARLEDRLLLSASPIGPEMMASGESGGGEMDSAFAADTDGDFVAVWSSDDSGSLEIFGQLFGADGAAQGSEFQVNSITAGDQLDASVAMDANGNFVVVWTSNHDGTDDIYAQRFDASGSARGSEFRVNSATDGDQTDARVSMDADGNFVITWHSDHDGGDALVAQRFNAHGKTRGDEIQIHSAINFQPARSLADGASGSHDDPLADSAGRRSGRHELVFVDTNVQDYEQFVANLLDGHGSRHRDIVLLDGNYDGIAQVSDTLARYSDLDAVHFATHAADRAVKLGGTWLESSNLSAYAGEITGWGESLDRRADLLFYGCNLAGGDAGRDLLDDLHTLTGADVAASTDATGHERLDGDWDLEFTLGAVHKRVALRGELRHDWSGLLSTFTVTNTNNSGGGSLRQAIIDANALAGLDTITFSIAGAGPHTINPASALPTITDAVIIDGTTEPDFAGTPVIVLDGNDLAADALVLSATADGSTIRGLLIRDFGGDGIEIQAGSDGHTIAGNWIGRLTTAGGDAGAAEANAANGVNILGANNTIGGTSASDRNVFSGNATYGVRVANAGATGNVILGNYIGTDAAGSADVGNTLDGVAIFQASGNTVGGIVAGARNVISGNNDAGIEIGGAGATNNVIVGNYIGTNAAGTADLGNTSNGVFLSTDAANNTVGGPTTAARNLISGNDAAGVNIWTGTATNNVVQGNYIGSDVTGTAALGNLYGVRLISSASGNSIGGAAAGAGNLIAYNTSTGVLISTAGTGNPVVGNSIHSNGGLGIDLGGAGVTANDTGDGDSGANGLQNFPILTYAVTNGSTITLSGSLNSTASSTFSIDFYYGSAVDGTGYGEGRTYLGSTTVNTDASGNATFSNVLFSTAVPIGSYVTATATSTGNNTSEFSLARPAVVNSLWLSTDGDVSGSGTPGLSAWGKGETIQVGAPNFQLDPVSGTTNGTFASVFNLANFSSGVNIDAIEYVTRSITIGSGGNTLTLQAGDVLLSTDNSATLTSVNSLSVTADEMFLFRPTVAGVYSSGSFTMVLDNFASIHGGSDTWSLALVEQSTTVGDTTLAAGSFLFSRQGGAEHGDIRLFTPTGVGAGTTAGSVQILVEGSDAGIGISTKIYGLELIEQATTVGGVNLAAGTILMSVDGGDTIGTNNLTVTENDVFGLTFTTTTLGSGSASASATMLLDGSDVALNNKIDALSLFHVVNNAPALDAAKSPALSAINEDAGAPVGAVGTLVSSLVDFASPAGQVDNVTDSDSGAVLGVAVTAADATNGTWWYSTNGGTNWNTVGSVSDASARLLAADANTRLYFQPNAEYSGTIANAITFRAWDQTSGGNGATANTTTNGGITAFSSASDTASLVVNAVDDAPVAAADSYSVNEDGSLAVNWWDADWARRSQVTLSGNTFAGSENLANFPVLVVLNGGNIDYSLTQNAGQDLRFFDADGTALAYEVESWNESGNSYVWVRVPQVDTTGSDSIWMYYGNASAAAGQDAAAVWSGNSFTGVYHLNDSSASINDSSASNYDGTNGGTIAAAGQTAGSRDFESSASNFIDLGTNRSFLDGASGATVSAWINRESTSGTGEALLSTSITNGGVPSNSSRVALQLLGDNLYAIVRTDDSTLSAISTTTNPLAGLNGTWHSVSVAVDASADTLRFYVDGNLIDPATYSGALSLPGTAFPGTPSAAASMGANEIPTNEFYDGLLDEGRIAAAARSDAWVKAEHLTMTNSFVAVGAAQTAPATGGVLGNDSDIDSPRLAAVLVSGPSNAASFTLNADGTFNYTPTANFAGTDSFTYKVNDGSLDSNVATVTITVNPINDPSVLGGIEAGALGYTENSGAVAVTGSLAVGDVDDTNIESAQVRITSGYTNGEDVLAFANTLTITGSWDAATGTLTLTGSDTLANYQAALRSVTYENLSENPSVSTRTVGFSVNDGDATSNTVTRDVNMTRVNDAPVITSNGGGASAGVSVAENATAVTTVASSDVDGGVPVFSISGGADAALFTINGSTGALAFAAAPNFEAPADAGANNVYDVTVQVSDGAGGTDTQAISVTVTDVDEFDVGAISDTNAAANAVNENAANGSTVGVTAFASDADGSNNAITYSLDNSAGGRFAIDGSTGVVTVADGSLLDRESAASHNITVRATSVDGSFSTQGFTITLNPVNDNSPIITSNGGGATASISIAENATAVTTVTATDADLPVQTLSYSIVGGADAARFTIDSSTGALSFVSAPNFESPTDANADNVYEVTVQVSDGLGLTDSQAISVNVEDLRVSTDSQTTGLTTGSSLTLSHTASGTDRLMLVTVSMANPGGRSVSGVTYNGDSLLFVGAQANGSNEARIEIWALVAPDLGSHNVVVTLTGANSTGTVIGVTTFTGVDQSTPLGTFASAGGDSSNPTVSVGSGADELVFAGITVESGTNYNLAPGAGQSELWDLHLDDANSGASTEAGAASVTMSWSFGDSNQWAVGAISIRPTVGTNYAPTITSNGGGDSASVSIAENTSAITTVAATDPDMPPQTLTYSITGGDDSGRFSIDSSTGTLTFVTAPDFETPLDADGDSVYEVTVQASDGAGGSDTQSIAVTVTGVNDNNPIISSNGGGATASISVAENTTAVTTVTATDSDLPSQSLTYSISGGADAALFSIDGSTGALGFTSSRNRESPTDANSDNVYEVTVQVSDGSGGTDSQAISVTITDVDEFDVSAISDTNGAANAVNENAANGTTVGVTAFASDADATTNTITYSLDDSAGGRFAIDGTTGVVTVADGSLLDREAAISHNITVRATSSDTSFSTATFTINLNDVDEYDVGPVSDSNLGANAVNENAANGTTVGVTAFSSDLDATNNAIAYSLDDSAGGRFAIDSSTGIVTVADGTLLDRESAASHAITVRASGSDGSFSTAVFSINLNDVDEFDVGAVGDSDGAANSVAENAAAGTVVGITALAVDGDTTDTVSYSLDDDAGGRFAIDATTGVVTVSGALDYETATSHSIIVRAASTDGSSSTALFAIFVSDVNESVVSPISDTDAAAEIVAENAANGTTVGITAFADDLDGSDTVSYSLDDDAGGRFTIDAATGVVTVNGAIDYESATSHTITARATSTDGSFSTRTFTIGVTDVDEFDVGAISDTDAAADTVAENSAAGTVVGLTAFADDADGTDTVSYSLDDDAGGRFAIDATTGVVTVSGTIDYESATSHTVTVRATSTDGSMSTRAFAIAVTDVDEFDVGPISDIDAAAETVAENAAAGTTVGITAFANDADGTDSVSYSLDNDAGGRFTINAATGIVTVSGPLDFETATSHSISVRATSTDGSFSTQSFAINLTDVNDTAPAITGGQSFSVAENSANGINIGAVGATDPDTVGSLQNWTITAGNTDGIFAIDATTGAISVIDNTNLNFEATSSYTLTITVEDGVNTSAPQTVTIDIMDVNESPVAVADAYGTNEDAPLVVAAAGVLANDSDVDGDTLSAVLVTGPANGSLTLNADGSFTYTPGADWNGSDSFTYRAVDSRAPALDSNVVTVNLTVNAVNDAPVAADDSYTVAADDKLTVAAAGVLTNDGDVEGDPLAAAIVTGPTNGTLTFNADGSFTYDPNAGFSGTDSFTYVVTDGLASSSIAAVTVTVDSVVIGPPILPPDPGFDDVPGIDDPPDPDPLDDGDPGEADSRLEDAASGQQGRRAEPRRSTSGGLDHAVSIQFGVHVGPLSDEAEQLAHGRDWLQSMKRISQQAARSAARLQAPNYLAKDLMFAVNTELLWDKLDAIHEQFESNKVQLYTVGTATALTTAVSAGYVWWTLRGGYLIASALSSIPAWRLIDPLPILQGFGMFKGTTAKDERRREEEESLASLVTESQLVKKGS